MEPFGPSTVYTTTMIICYCYCTLMTFVCINIMHAYDNWNDLQPYRQGTNYKISIQSCTRNPGAKQTVKKNFYHKDQKVTYGQMWTPTTTREDTRKTPKMMITSFLLHNLPLLHILCQFNIFYYVKHIICVISLCVYCILCSTYAKLVQSPKPYQNLLTSKDVNRFLLFTKPSLY